MERINVNRGAGAAAQHDLDNTALALRRTRAG